MVSPGVHTWWSRASAATLIVASSIAIWPEITAFRVTGWPFCAVLGLYFLSEGIQLVCLARRPEAASVARSARHWGSGTVVIGLLLVLTWIVHWAFGLPATTPFRPMGLYFALAGAAWLWVLLLGGPVPLLAVVFATTNWPAKLPLYLARRARARWAVVILFAFGLVTIVLGNLGTCRQLREIQQELSTLQHR